MRDSMDPRHADKATVGIMMLETNFPRPLGDIGNEQTWDFPVQMRIVDGASAKKVVQQKEESRETKCVVKEK
jgi:hypothetical protein